MTKTIMITAGGTGGHIFPGLAVAELFMQQGDKVIWIGTDKGLETTLVPQQNIPLLTIPMQGLRGKGVLPLFKAPFLLMKGIQAARRLIKQEQPAVILGMGGYVSAPVGIAAKLCSVPLVIHEQNAIAGMSNNLLAKIAAVVCESFANTFPKAVLTGNPVRPAISALAGKKTVYQQAPLKVLVLGGSQGARAINQVIPDFLAAFPAESAISLWHQTGSADYEAMQTSYQQKQLTPYKVEAFIQDMAAAYAWADLVICRAGATTVAELAGIGLPAIFVPLPTAVDDHQTANAANLVKKGAAILLPQIKLSARHLFERVHQLQLAPEQLQQMSQHKNAEAPDNAATQLAAICRSYMK